MSILAIDPGPTMSAHVLYDVDQARPLAWSKLSNDTILDLLNWTTADTLAIEMIASYGMPVGAEVFNTCCWIGHFEERWDVDFASQRGLYLRRWRVPRADVKLHLCGSMRAKDTNIRQALIDRYGGSREVAIGRKASPGVLYGFTADCWQALAVAVTAAETVLAKAEAA